MAKTIEPKAIAHDKKNGCSVIDFGRRILGESPILVLQKHNGLRSNDFSKGFEVRKNLQLMAVLNRTSASQFSVALATIFLFCSTVGAEQFERGSFQAADQQKLLYRLSKPSKLETHKKYPLVVCLHGRGSRGNDNEKPLREFQQLATNPAIKEFPCFMVVSQCPVTTMWCEFRVTGDGKSLKGGSNLYKAKPTAIANRVLQLVSAIDAQFPFDPDRVYITGLSMGGYGTWDLIVREPNRFAAAAPLCGDGDQSKVKRLAHIPIWIAHGAKDPIVSVKYSREMKKALERVTSKLVYKEFPNGNHRI